MKKVFEDKHFLKTLITLAIPIVFQSLVTSSLNLVDNMMVGELGETAIASVGLANQFIFIFTLCLLGVNAGASVFMSQFWGKKDLQKVKTFLGIDMVVSMGASVIFAAIAFFAPQIIMGILSKDAEVIALGSTYLKIVAASCLVMSFTQAYSAALRSTEQTKVPMFASIMGVLVNAFLNWVFIFGHLGMPALGVAGAAVATLIARIVEMVFIIAITYMTKNKVAAKWHELFNFDRELMKTYFKTSWSVIVNELVFSIGMATYSIAYARISTNAVATMQIATTLSNMFITLLIGIATAASIMIGNKIGASEEEVAKDYASHVGKITPFVGLILGLGIWLFAPLILQMFNVAPETYADTLTVLKIMAIFMPLRAFNMVMIVGVFRGGGDTTYSMYVQAGTIWLYSVPVALVGAIFFGFSVTTVFFLICTEECIKVIFELSRLKSGKWLKNLVA